MHQRPRGSLFRRVARLHVLGKHIACRPRSVALLCWGRRHYGRSSPAYVALAILLAALVPVAPRLRGVNALWLQKREVNDWGGKARVVVRQIVVKQGIRQPSTDLHEVLHAEVAVRQRAKVGATERGLQRVAVLDVDLSRHHHAARTFSSPLHRKAAVLEADIAPAQAIPAQQLWEHAHCGTRLLLVVAAVHEAVHLPAVPVEVQEGADLPHGMLVADHGFRVVDRRMQRSRGLLPGPVEIHRAEAAAVVAEDHPIGIQHRNDLEDEHGAQLLGRHALTREEIKQASHHPRCRGLSRVHAPRQHNRSLARLAKGASPALIRRGQLVCVFRPGLPRRRVRESNPPRGFAEVRNGQQVHLVTTETCAESRSADVAFPGGIGQNRRDVSLLIREGERVAVGDEDSIARMSEFHAEAEGVVLILAAELYPRSRLLVSVFTCLPSLAPSSSVLVLPIEDVVATAHPTHAFLPRVHHAVADGTHPLIEQTVRLCEIADPERHVDRPGVAWRVRVGHAEIEPLHEPRRVQIRSQEEIILVLVTLHSAQEVPALEARLEGQGVAKRPCRICGLRTDLIGRGNGQSRVDSPSRSAAAAIHQLHREVLGLGDRLSLQSRVSGRVGLHHGGIWRSDGLQELLAIQLEAGIGLLPTSRKGSRRQGLLGRRSLLLDAQNCSFHA
eukprot:scaffold285_cov304-Pinguiococcus_pyrenoidosus.AAC.13